MSDIICPPPEFDWELITLTIDAANNGDDIGLSPAELLTINSLLPAILAAYPDVFQPGDGSAAYPVVYGSLVGTTQTPRIRLNLGLLGRLRDAIRRGRGRLHDMMTAAHKAQTESMIQELLNAHTPKTPGAPDGQTTVQHNPEVTVRRG